MRLLSSPATSGLALALAPLIACAPGESPAVAADRPATPATLREVLAAARPGDRVVLAGGSYGDVSLPKTDHARPVVVDARRATLKSLRIQNTAGWTWQGGRIDGDLPPRQYFDVAIDGARRIELRGVTLTGSMVGVTVTRGSEDILLKDNVATGLQSDGFNVNGGRRITLDGNSCADFRPILPIYDAAGKLVKDGTHNDCVQMWSVAGQAPLSDIVVTRTRARGYMQGIGQYYSGGPIRNLTVTDNDIEVRFWHAISFSDVQGAVVTGNRIRTEKGAKAANFPFQSIRSWLKITGSDVRRCDNEVDGARDRGC